MGKPAGVNTYIVDLGIVSTTLEVFSFDESLNAFLDNAWLGLEKRKLGENLRNQLLMLQGLSSFHDSYDGSLDSD